MRDALRRVKAELGSDATIVGSRTAGGLRGGVEVTASAAARGTARPSPAGDAFAGLDPRAKRAAAIVRELAKTGSLPAAAVPDAAVDRLTALDFAPAAARHYAGLLGDGPLSDLKPILAEDLPVGGGIAADPDRRCVAAFVGPTGVGKTTTLAKLAARLSLRSGRSVGLVTTDTHRIGAVEQLATYARILAVPCEVAAEPGDLPAALSRLEDRDVILIDTAGRAPRDGAHLSELASALGDQIETHLVLSAASGHASLGRAAERYAAFRPASTVLTKLDEADGAGAAVDLLRSAPPAPVSHLAFGQDVPDDLAAATPATLAAAALGEWERLSLHPEPAGGVS